MLWDRPGERLAPRKNHRHVSLSIAALAVVLVGAACSDAPVVDGRVRCTPVASETQTVAIDPPWASGVERTYEIAAATDFGGGLEVGLPDPTWAKLSVEQPTDDGWSMAWRAVPPDVALTVWQFDGAPLTPTVARYEWGSGVERPQITNPFELGLWLGDAVDRTRLALPAGQTASFDANVAHYETMVGVEFDLLFLSPAELLHIFDGLELDVDDVLEVSRPIVNGVTDEPLRAQATVEIVEMEDPSGCVLLRMTRSPDAEEFSEVMRLELAAQGSDETGARFEMEQTLLAQYDAGSGFIKTVTMTGVVDAAGLRLSDTTTITDITAGAASER